MHPVIEKRPPRDEEHDRLRVQRERIAKMYGHQPKQPIVRVTPPQAAERRA
jgi:hypothetical protein